MLVIVILNIVINLTCKIFKTKAEMKELATVIVDISILFNN